MAVDIKNYVTTDSIELNVDLVRCIRDPYKLSHERVRAAVRLTEDIKSQLSPEDRARLEGEMEYICNNCDNEFPDNSLAHSEGYAQCPECGSKEVEGYREHEMDKADYQEVRK